MRRRWRRISLASVFASVLAVASQPAKAELGGYIAGGLGAFDFINGRTVAEGRLEFRFDQSILFLHPLIGTFFTNEGSVYAYGGVRFEVPLGKQLLILPVATAGYYEKGSGKDLGSHLEFKTGVEIDYAFDNGIRVGPAFDHVSNAGVGKKNPGEENLMLMVSVPLGSLAP